MKYIVQDNINFYEELYKSLDNDNDNDNDNNNDNGLDLDNDDNNLCLITNKKLTDKYIKLNCGHKFNYIPLYNDLVNYKCKFVNMESNQNFLSHNQIRCPYCRNKQFGILPYYDDLNLPKVHGVNFLDEVKLPNVNKCCYKEKNDLYNESLEESTIANPKYFYCYNPGFKINNKMYNLDDNFNDTNHYCYHHKIQIIKKYREEQKAKLKEEKLKLKEEKMKEKALEKLKQKEIKKQEKENAKLQEKMDKKEKKDKKDKKETKSGQQEIENVILGPSIISSETINEEPTYCVQILKTGPNKGLKCLSLSYKDEFCKRHYNLKTK